MTILELETQQHEGATHIAFNGELDLSSAEQVETELRKVEDTSPELLVLDLSKLRFLDSTGLRLIVTADQRSRQSGRRMAIVKGPENVHRVFSITKLDERLEMVDSAAELTAS